MEKVFKPEVWLRGPLPGISPYLQPVAHALLQAREEVAEMMQEFPENLVWQRPAGMASVGFHLQHLSGVLDRLFTYARGEALSAQQLEQLQAEGKAEKTSHTAAVLRQLFEQQVTLSLQQLRKTPEQVLLETRGVGRAQLPSTVLGLLVHAAEHTQRHTGQLLVTTTILRAAEAEGN